MKQLLETACDRERVAILFNPVCGTENGDLRRARLERLVRDAGLTCGLTQTEAKQGAGPLARDARAHGMERLLVAGGDGSLAEAAQALAGTETALAILPSGTGNVLAANLGLPHDMEACLRLALTGEARPFDVGRANGTVFLIMAGMGADGRIIRDADRKTKRRLGILAYFVAGLKNLGRSRTPYRITIDGKTIRRRAKTVLVANLGRIPGGIDLVPGADPEDGLLEIVIVRARTLPEMALVAARMLLGRLQDDPLWEIRRGKHIVIEAPWPEPIETDGNEAGSATRLEVCVEPGALRLVRPEDEAERRTAGTHASDKRLFLWLPLLAGLGSVAVVSVFLRKRRMVRKLR